MPAYHSSSPSPSTTDSSQRLVLTGSSNISFLDYLKLFNDDNSFITLSTALFGRQDIIIKTNELKHLAPLVERLQDEANQQQEYMQEIFNSMEMAGLHKILKKYFI